MMKKPLQIQIIYDGFWFASHAFLIGPEWKDFALAATAATDNSATLLAGLNTYTYIAGSVS
jgi:hypothetical protein